MGFVFGLTIILLYEDGHYIYRVVVDWNDMMICCVWLMGVRGRSPCAERSEAVVKVGEVLGRRATTAPTGDM